MKFFLVLLSVAALAYSSPVPKDESVLKSVVGSFVNCMNSDVNLCVKEHALRAVERLGTMRKLKIFDGLTILNSDPREARSLESLSFEPQLRNKEVTERLWEKANDLLENGEMEISIGAGDDEESRSLDAEEGRGKKKDIKKKMKMLMPLMHMLKAKFAALAVLFLGIIAISIWKLAIIAKIAFIAKVIAIIKALLAKKHEEHSGWEHGHEEHGHGHGGWESQGWGRSGKIEGADMAYAGYKQQ